MNHNREKAAHLTLMMAADHLGGRHEFESEEIEIAWERISEAHESPISSICFADWPMLFRLSHSFEQRELSDRTKHRDSISRRARPNNVSTIRLDIDPRRDLAIAAPLPCFMFVNEMQAAARCFVGASYRQALRIGLKPPIAAMARINVDDINATDDAGWYSNQRASIE
jgi:hypothetical protein